MINGTGSARFCKGTLSHQEPNRRGQTSNGDRQRHPHTRQGARVTRVPRVVSHGNVHTAVVPDVHSVVKHRVAQSRKSEPERLSVQQRRSLWLMACSAGCAGPRHIPQAAARSTATAKRCPSYPHAARLLRDMGCGMRATLLFNLYVTSLARVFGFECTSTRRTL